MKKIRLTLVGILFFSLGLVICSISFASQMRNVVVFHSPSCHRCIKVKADMLPVIAQEFKDRVQIEYANLEDTNQYLRLIGLKQQFNSSVALELPVFFMEGQFLNGKDVTTEKIRNFILSRLNSRDIFVFDKSFFADPLAHFLSFKPFLVLGAGLVDGFNPCAFSVVVFFVSFLILQGYRRRDAIIIGCVFIAVVFCTYILIGLGIFGFLYRLSGFSFLVRITNIVIGLLSIVLGIVTVLDWIKYRKTGNPEDMKLKLPDFLKKRIHTVIGNEYRNIPNDRVEQKKKRTFWLLVLSAASTGFVVSLLEAVCTGQTYLPTIVFVLKEYKSMKAIGLLLGYNLMFIAPLFLVFVLAVAGVSSQRFAQFMRVRMGVIKISMALLFFVMGLFLVWRA